MVSILMRSRATHNTIAKQQKIVSAYAKQKNLEIDRIEVDSSMPNTTLMERDESLKFLHSTVLGDKLLIDDLWVLSTKIGELVKIFDCLLKKNVDVHLCSKSIVISKDMALTELLSILTMERQKNLSLKQHSSGRPKGSQSKSKFDRYRAGILKMLHEDMSVFAIAKKLGVSRSSLKDYINSRNLKEIAQGIDVDKELISSTIPINKKCQLQNAKEHYEYS